VETGEKLAAEIDQAGPRAVGLAKRVIDGFADIERGLMLEGWAQSELFSSEDFEERIQNYIKQVRGE
jgi:3-hydroxypropionyl-coenzyme A dehydratase